jgi:ketosteroid isomerase-like protein
MRSWLVRAMLARVLDNPRTVPEESTTHDLAERMKRSVEAFNAGDFDLAASFYAPDALFYPRAVGVLEGREAIRSFFEDWHGMYEEFTFELEEFRDLGSGVLFSVVRQGGRLADTAAWIHDRFALVFTGADGLIETEMNFTDAEEARAAAEKLAQERDRQQNSHF